MKKPDNYRFAEKCLYEYPSNCARLVSLRAELDILRSSSDVRGHSYEVGGNVQSSHSDPVSFYMEKIEALEHEVKRVERYTEPVSRLCKDITGSNVLGGSRKEDYSQILHLYYFGGNSPQQIMSFKHWSRSVFYERRKKLVQTAIEYLGLS